MEKNCRKNRNSLFMLKVIFVILLAFCTSFILFKVKYQKNEYIPNKNLMLVAPKEIVSERTYNQEVFDLGSGVKKYEIHAAQIHYKDENGNFQKINTSLAHDENQNAFVVNRASYIFKIPEYADSVFEFDNTFEDNNKNLKIIPQAKHVEGEAFNTSLGNYVLYKDAFGQGIDLRVYAYWAGLKKEVVINGKPASDYLNFDFELVVPQDQEILDQNGKAWDKKSVLDFKDKTIRIGKDGKYSYLRNARLWDSAQLNLPVDIMLFSLDRKVYLRKTIKKDILEKAVYPLYTDDTVNYYAGAGDGHVYYYTTSDWNTCHDASDGYAADYTYATTNPMTYRVTEGGYQCYIYRSFFPIDTSAIDDGATINSGKFYFYATDYKDDSLSGNMNLI